MSEAVTIVRATWSRQGLLPLIIPAGAAGFCALFLAFLGMRAGDSAQYDVTPASTGFALFASAVIASGALVLLRLRQGSIGPLFALATGALVFTVLALFSIGLLVLPVGLLLLVIAVRRLRRRGTPAAVRAAAAGAAIGIGGIAFLLAMLQLAVAVCRSDGGGATSSGGLFGRVSYSSGGYSTATGESGGYIDEGDRIAYFTCAGGKMTDFHRLPLPQGSWVVTTQPSATVGRTVQVVFRVRPTSADDPGVLADGFDLILTCRSCAEPRPTVRGHAVPDLPSGARGRRGVDLLRSDRLPRGG